MKKVKFHYNYPINIDIDTEEDVEVFVDQFPMTPIPSNSIRIIILEEPGEDTLAALAQKHRDKYTHLLTFRQEILDTNPKAKLFLCMNTWVRNYVSPNKKFCVSNVVGGKSNPRFTGYALRHELWHWRASINIPKDFYLSGSAPFAHIFVPWRDVDYTGELVLGDSKIPLFDSMFHIAIENLSMRNYFSEKILDCFQSRTVPIYCGCPNIGDFFNIDGILIARTVDEIITTCNNLAPETYNSLIPAIEDNFNRSIKWCDHQEQIRIGVINLLNK